MPRYPVYVISKGRWKSRLTSKWLEKMSVPYRIVIEKQEYDEYAAVIDPSKILVLPFANLGQGSIPARNWVWEHSIEEGAERHWILDDNIDGWGRLNQNQKIKCESPAIFCAMEDFVDRYENVGLAGCEYDYFLPRKRKVKPFRLNTRVYSNILILNSLPHRWRGRFNEDTDLSLRVLKDGWCTILFQAFIAYKIPTLQMGGGNTDELYKNTNRRREFAESIVKQHPDVARVVWKYNRWHHEVDYTKFKYNELIKKKGLKIEKGINNYGMELKNV